MTISELLRQAICDDCKKYVNLSFSRADFERLVRRAELMESLLRLCQELDIEMDGVRCPATAAAILNGNRSHIAEIDCLDDDWNVAGRAGAG